MCQTETGGTFPDSELEEPLAAGSDQPGDVDDDW